jgi:hypothetical protein
LKPPKRNAAATPTREEPTKSLHHQGTSPMKESGQNGENNNNEDSTSKANMSLNLDSLVKSDSKEFSSNKEDTEADSIANEITTLRAQLFKGGTQETASKGHKDRCNSTAITASTKDSRKAKPRVPIAKRGCTEAEVPKRGAVFVEGTHFNNKPGKPLKKKPGKATLSTLTTSVIQIKIKLLNRVMEVQGTITRKGIKVPVSSAGTNMRRQSGQKTSLRISLTFTANGDYGKRGRKSF